MSPAKAAAMMSAVLRTAKVSDDVTTRSTRVRAPMVKLLSLSHLVPPDHTPGFAPSPQRVTRVLTIIHLLRARGKP